MFKDVQKLVERCIFRDERAWEIFIERFSGILYHSARERLRRSGITFGQQDIEDVVQSVFLDIWEKNKLEEVRERKKISAWLSIVAQTRALNYMQRKKDRLLRKEEFYKIDNIKADSGRGPDEQLMQELEKAIEALDAKEKIIFKLNIVYGKTHREIAKFMDMPTNTISTIIARRKKTLMKDLKIFERGSGRYVRGD